MKYAKVKFEQYGGQTTKVMILLETVNDVNEAKERYGTYDDKDDIDSVISRLPCVMDFPSVVNAREFKLSNYIKRCKEVIASENIGPLDTVVGPGGPGGMIRSHSWRISNRGGPM